MARSPTCGEALVRSKAARWGDLMIRFAEPAGPDFSVGRCERANFQPRSDAPAAGRQFCACACKPSAQNCRAR
jgi:hypothetical protein